MNLENGKLYVVHDQIPEDKIGWNLYIPELFYFWNEKKYKIINKAPSWTEGIIKKKPIGTYRIDNKVPSSISLQILPIIQKQENKTMTSRQIKLVENYIRGIVRKTLKENFGDEFSTEGTSRQDLQSLMNYLDVKGISYDFDGPNEIISFDITELGRNEQEIVRKILKLAQ